MIQASHYNVNTTIYNLNEAMASRDAWGWR